MGTGGRLRFRRSSRLAGEACSSSAQGAAEAAALTLQTKQEVQSAAAPPSQG
jgi:hypothetical protein